MEIKIKASVDLVENQIDITLTDEELDNYNFVDLVVNGVGHTIAVEDLYLAVLPFMERADRQQGMKTCLSLDCPERTGGECNAGTDKEIIICAAIKLEDGRVLRCHRHGDGLGVAWQNKWKVADGRDQQGFVTSTNRYVSREEGRKLQDAAGIPSADPEGYRGNTLFSEDLY